MQCEVVLRKSYSVAQDTILIRIFLLKPYQVYETCSSADALKIGERNPVQSAFDYYFAMSCNHQTILNLKCTDGLSSQHCNSALLFSYDVNGCSTAVLLNSFFLLVLTHNFSALKISQQLIKSTSE